MGELKRLQASAGASAIYKALSEDGVCVVEGAVSTNHVNAMNNEFEALTAATTPQMRPPSHEQMRRFYGEHTIRIDGIPGKSPTFVDFMQDPLIHDVCQQVLRPNCSDYLLNVAQLIQIGPGERTQRLHRDEEAWPHMPVERPTLSVQAMIALTDFTADNGATQVVPGSHLWVPGRTPEANEIQSATMSRGCALYYLGRTLHGGGANHTSDESRRGLFLFLRTRSPPVLRLTWWVGSAPARTCSSPYRLRKSKKCQPGYRSYLGTSRWAALA